MSMSVKEILEAAKEEVEKNGTPWWQAIERVNAEHADIRPPGLLIWDIELKKSTAHALAEMAGDKFKKEDYTHMKRFNLAIELTNNKSLMTILGDIEIKKMELRTLKLKVSQEFFLYDYTSQ